LVDKLNDRIKLAANSLEPWGVIYVDGYNEGFNDRRFCEHRNPKCIHQWYHQDNDMSNGFWSYWSPWNKTVPNDGEGKAITDICHKDELANADERTEQTQDEVWDRIEEALVPNPEERKKLQDNKELAPWDVSEGDWDKYEDIHQAMMDRLKLHPEEDRPRIKWAADSTYRMFHPKKSGYKHFADKLMEKIRCGTTAPNESATESRTTRA
jgi:hypothetical protein